MEKIENQAKLPTLTVEEHLAAMEKARAKLSKAGTITADDLSKASARIAEFLSKTSPIL